MSTDHRHAGADRAGTGTAPHAAPGKKAAFIIPYYGALPNYFQIFLNSCGANRDFDWLLFTDDRTAYDYPDNVHVHYETFADMQERARRRFDFLISLDKPYKLCDFRPAYGLLFAEYLTGYPFWGHCDCDLVFGRLGRFVTDDMLAAYDKIFMQGHCSLYRNDERTNRAFMLPLEGEEVYRRVLSSARGFTFDESYLPTNVNRIFQEHGLRLFTTDLSANTYSRSAGFRLVHYDAALETYMVEAPNRAVYVWDDGVLSRSSFRFGRFVTTELMYLHLQRRAMRVDPRVEHVRRFKILPGFFEPLEVEEVTSRNFRSIRWRRPNGHRWRILTGDVRFWMRRIRGKVLGVFGR